MQAQHDQTHQRQVTLGGVIDESVMLEWRTRFRRQCRGCRSPVDLDLGLHFPFVMRRAKLSWPSGSEPSLLSIPGQRFGDSVPERGGADETQFLAQAPGVADPARRAQFGVLLPAQHVRLAGQPRNGLLETTQRPQRRRRQRQRQRPRSHLRRDFAANVSAVVTSGEAT